jgi:hypothetical protein
LLKKKLKRLQLKRLLPLKKLQLLKLLLKKLQLLKKITKKLRLNSFSDSCVRKIVSI